MAGHVGHLEGSSCSKFRKGPSQERQPRVGRQEAAPSGACGCARSPRTPGPGLWAPSVRPAIARGSSFLRSQGEECLTALQTAAAGTDAASHILVTFPRGRGGEEEKGIEKKEVEGPGAKIQNLLEFCLTFHLSLLHTRVPGQV